MYLDTREPQPTTPQVALRAAIIGVVAIVLFGILFLRLWYLQVLSGNRYLAEANDNRVREIKVAAPRGEIVDRTGGVLVDNHVGLAVRVSPSRLPAEGHARSLLYVRLGKVLGVRPKAIRKRMREQIKV